MPIFQFYSICHYILCLLYFLFLDKHRSLYVSVLDRIYLLFEKNKEVPAHVFPELGYSKGYLSELKRSEQQRGRGYPSAEAVIKLSDYFNVTTDYILKGSISDLTLLSSEELSWLELFKRIENLSEKDKSECISFIKGYIQAYIDIEKINHTGGNNNVR